MSSEDVKGGKEKRARRRAAGLRKHQHIENVVVEETFTLSSKDDAYKGKAGDGAYVSATVASKRLYGVLVDQPALREATSLWLQDQADSLELSRRIKVLKQQENGDGDALGTASAEPTSHQSDSGAHENGGVPERENANHSDAVPQDTLAIPSDTIVTAAPAGEAKDEVRSIGRRTSPLPTPYTSEHKNALESTDMAESAKRVLEDASASEQSEKRVRAGVSLYGRSKPDDWQSSHEGNSEKYPQLMTTNDRPVQKFKYIMGNHKRFARRGEQAEDPGYRLLVATFANVQEAASGDLKQARAIEAACEEGGNYLSDNPTYYYQYEVLPTVLASSEEQAAGFDLRTSMGFHTFLQNTPLPPWFPLSNLQMRQGNVLNMFNMKKDNQGNLTWDPFVADGVSSAEGAAAALAGGTKVTMQPRPKKRYQIGVVGGGIAGIACCQELVSLLKLAGVDYHITLFEGRSRLGGRLWTDPTFHTSAGQAFPVELGASWIHGIDDNPLAALAKEAGIDFVTSSEEVQMLGKGMRRIDSKMDERSGKLFDDLLDHAADECWSSPETIGITDINRDQDPQAAIRWYSSVFVDSKDADASSGSSCKPQRIGVPSHRQSSDRSIDVEMGRVILKHKLGDFSKLSSDEHRMLLWNTKNIEYALGANIADLSMKYWDADEHHAFEGDHVMLRQGYSKLIDYMLKSIEKTAGDNFEVLLNFPVGQIEYARKSTTIPYGLNRFVRNGEMVDLSDSCSVTSQDASQTKYLDFVVCACPLGVLKESIFSEEDSRETLSFQPSLPFSKVDAISNVGFGLMDKVYLTFPEAFWRQEGFFKDKDQCLFGNISGVNPHHYMFFDIGRCVGSGDNAPPILMSLISGQEAVACETLSDQRLVDQVVTTLRAIFTQVCVPEPTSFRFTRWGRDKFSRGSYTFLPPGATDQDFHLLQSPINGNGDSLLLEGSETMRLFFAGEHTTALHPSMAHGAMLSGMRAAKEIVSTIQFKFDEDKDNDRIIPVALFRHKNASTDLRCNLCHKVGGQIREGFLLAFKRGARQVLVHNNCAEYSPEVEVQDSKWKNVIRAVNRGRSLICSLCKESGATIGCTAENCYRVFHFSCSEDAGWRFERDGKVFYCDLHRKQSREYTDKCVRISMDFYLSKNPASSSLFCRLCGGKEDGREVGQLLAFQYGRRHALVHENCIRYTSICDTTEVEDSRMGHEYKNVFLAIDESRRCSTCSAAGATVRCTKPGCNRVYHVLCAEKENWNLAKRVKKFRCSDHRKKQASASAQHNEQSVMPPAGSSNAVSFFNHNLLAQFGAAPTEQSRMSVQGNLDMSGRVPVPNGESRDSGDESDDGNGSEDSTVDMEQSDVEDALGLRLSTYIEGPTRLVKVKRPSNCEPWGLSLSVVFRREKKFLAVVVPGGESNDRSFEDIVVAIDGQRVGEGPTSTLREIASSFLRDRTDLTLEVGRVPQ